MSSGAYIGDFVGDETVPFWFTTYDSDGASVTLTGLAVTDIEIYKGTSVTQRSSDAGYALIDTDGIDIDSTTGFHGFSVDLSDNTDAGFYAVGNDFCVLVNAVTVDSQTVRFIAGRFSIQNRANIGPLSDIESSLVIIKSDLVVVESDTTVVEAAVSDVESSLVIVKSDLVVIDAAVSDVESSLVIVKSDLVLIDQDASDIKSDLVVIDDAVSDVESSLVIVKSDLVVIESDTTAIEAGGGSLTAAQASQLTQIQSDVIVVDAAVSDVESSLVIVKSDLVIVVSDSTAIEVVTDALGSSAASNLALSAAGIIGGVAQTGTLSTTVMTTDLTGFADDELIGRYVIWTGGTANGQASSITDYASTNGTVTYTAIATAPANNDTFVIV